MACTSCQGSLKPKPDFATVAVHVGHDPDKWNCRSVVPPIVMASTFKQRTPGMNDYFYGRCGNPTRNTLEECLAALDDGKYGFAFASGLGAITCISSLLSKGDHIVCMDDVYGGTSQILSKIFPRMGIETTFVDITDLEKFEKAIQENTKMIFIETPSNPTIKVVDLAATAEIIKRHKDILMVVDNTFLTPYLQRPLDFGADIVVYSLTKYMNGHSDVIMGAAVVNNRDLADKLRFLQMTMGIVPSPFDCYLVNRSLKTLALRMERHKESSLKIAKWLESHPKVKEVKHPGLVSHAQHCITLKQTCGHSGVFSFIHCGGLQESKNFLNALKLFTLCVSLGGHESLAELPTIMTHGLVPKEQKKEVGITDDLIRLSIGLEDVEDLIKDLDQAFDAAF